CRPQASQSARLARPAPPLGVSFHTHFLFLGQCGRDLLCDAHPTAVAAWRLSLPGRPAGPDQPLPPRTQPQTPNPASGPPIPTASSRRSIEGIKCWRRPLGPSSRCSPLGVATAPTVPCLRRAGCVSSLREREHARYATPNSPPVS